MSELFSEYPVLEDDRLIIRKMTLADVKALEQMCANPRVYRYVPTFLYEQKYEDKAEVIEKMDAECFAVKDSLMLGIYDKENHEQFVGIGEVYAYEPERKKVSLGCRLDEPYWHGGIAPRASKMLIRWLLEDCGIKIITAHIMKENKASERAAENSGFVLKYPDCLEDWGFDKPVLIDKFVIKIYD